MNVYNVTGHGILTALMLISYIDNLPFWSDHESEIQLGLKAISA